MIMRARLHPWLGHYLAVAMIAEIIALIANKGF
jgi:hypothetical protein